jgi:crotonobetainyl-CoA:carnitine CoA-transferase CaiB-like acyl-CoA transferase
MTRDSSFYFFTLLFLHYIISRLLEGSFVEIPGIRHKLVGNPIILSKANHIPTKGAPKFGEDTIDVLQSLGYSSLKIEELKKLGVISYPETK